MNGRSMKIFLAFVVVIGGFGFLLNVAYYGSFNDWLRGCPYREEKVVIPELLDAKIVVEREAYLVTGDQNDLCTLYVGSIDKFIMDNTWMDKSVNSADYRLRIKERGGKIENLAIGSEYLIVDVVIVTDNGIHGSFAGPGFEYIVLRDTGGFLYAVSRGDLGYDDDEAFLAYFKNGKKKGMLTWLSFKKMLGSHVLFD